MLAARGTVIGAPWTTKTKETRTAIFERNTIAELKSRQEYGLRFTGSWVWILP
jgi:hypothetical protein